MTSRARLARAAGYIVAAAGLAEIARQILATRPLAADALAAFAADLVAGRALLASWYGGAGSGKAALRGATFGAGAVIAAAAVALVFGKARLSGVAMGWDTLPLGAVAALAAAIRVEITCRVLPLGLLRDLAPRPWIYAFAVLAGAAPLLLEGPPRPGALALALGIGALSVALIETTRSAVAGVMAHAALRLTSGPLLTSTIEVRWSSGSLLPMDRADGIGAWLVAGACVALAAVTVRASKAAATRGT